MKNACTLYFASGNLHKLSEMQRLVPDWVVLKSMRALHEHLVIEETGNTFAENARIKARYVYQNYQVNTFADDSGLVIRALGGEPGVLSARYAGIHGNDYANIDKVLKNMKNHINREARFVCNICLIFDHTEISFEGVLEGNIAQEPVGLHGFGYDPIFIPEGYNQTLAQLPPSIKNSISHRSKAISKMIEYLLNPKSF